MLILLLDQFPGQLRELTMLITTEKDATILYAGFSDKIQFRFHGICLYKTSSKQVGLSVLLCLTTQFGG
jgi:hypothetical protein